MICPHCSSTVNETTISVDCENVGCWVHHICTKFSFEALTLMSSESVLWILHQFYWSRIKISNTEDNHRDGVQGRHKQQSIGNKIDTVRSESSVNSFYNSSTTKPFNFDNESSSLVGIFMRAFPILLMCTQDGWWRTSTISRMTDYDSVCNWSFSWLFADGRIVKKYPSTRNCFWKFCPLC